MPKLQSVILMFCFFTVSLGGIQAQAPAAAAVASRNERLAKDADSLMHDLLRQDFDAVSARFNAQMLAAVSVEQLRSMWTPLPAQIGTFLRMDPPTISESNGHVVFLIPCVFQRATLDAQIAYDAAGKVGGFFLKPHAPPPSAYVAPSYIDATSFEERALTIGTGALALPATLSLPKNRTALSAVVLVHGSGPHDRDESIGPNLVFRDLAWGLATKGIAVLRYEKRTKAHPEAFSGNAFTINDETVDDAVRAAQLLRGIPQIDAGHIYIAGHSQGAMMAPRIAQRDTQLAGLILLAAPARPLEDIVVEQQNYLARLGGSKPDQKTLDLLDGVARKRDEIKHLDPAKPQTEPLLLNLPARYWLDLRDYDPVAVAESLKLHILVLQGLRDFQVTAPDFKRWTQACEKYSRIHCESYPTLSHLFMPGGDTPGPKDYETPAHVDANVIADIANWIGTEHAARVH